MKQVKKSKMKLRWKLAILFALIPLIVLILVSLILPISEELKKTGLGDYLIYIYLLPINIINPLISQISCNDLVCVVDIKLTLVIASILSFYGSLGFLLGYTIEKVKKR